MKSNKFTLINFWPTNSSKRKDRTVIKGKKTLIFNKNYIIWVTNCANWDFQPEDRGETPLTSQTTAIHKTPNHLWIRNFRLDCLDRAWTRRIYLCQILRIPYSSPNLLIDMSPSKSVKQRNLSLTRTVHRKNVSRRSHPRIKKSGTSLWCSLENSYARFQQGLRKLISETYT